MAYIIIILLGKKFLQNEDCSQLFTSNWLGVMVHVEGALHGYIERHDHEMMGC